MFFERNPELEVIDFVVQSTMPDIFKFTKEAEIEKDAPALIHLRRINWWERKGYITKMDEYLDNLIGSNEWNDLMIDKVANEELGGSTESVDALLRLAEDKGYRLTMVTAYQLLKEELDLKES